MKFAIPLRNGKLSNHFGHAKIFALVAADPITQRITSREDLTPPPHDTGLLQQWLVEHGVGCVITGGMGPHSRNECAEKAIRVIVGAPAEEPETLVKAYLDGSLATGANTCRH
jgi:ATP-binding protein involved in chromosome partitioning